MSAISLLVSGMQLAAVASHVDRGSHKSFLQNVRVLTSAVVRVFILAFDAVQVHLRRQNAWQPHQCKPRRGCHSVTPVTALANNASNLVILTTAHTNLRTRAIWGWGRSEDEGDLRMRVTWVQWWVKSPYCLSVSLTMQTKLFVCFVKYLCVLLFKLRGAKSRPYIFHPFPIVIIQTILRQWANDRLCQPPDFPFCTFTSHGGVPSLLLATLFNLVIFFFVIAYRHIFF